MDGSDIEGMKLDGKRYRLQSNNKRCRVSVGTHSDNPNLFIVKCFCIGRSLSTSTSTERVIDEKTLLNDDDLYRVISSLEDTAFKLTNEKDEIENLL